MNKTHLLILAATLGGGAAAVLSVAHAQSHASAPVHMVALNESAPAPTPPVSRAPEPRASTDDYVNAHLMILGQYHSAGAAAHTAPAPSHDANS
jgi:hypothetical protein